MRALGRKGASTDDPMRSLSSAVAGRALRGAGKLPALRWSARGPAALGRDAGRPRWPPGEPALVLEQRLLERQATCVAGQAAIGADHPVARDEDADRVATVRAADGARRAVDRAGGLPVRDGLAVRDLLQARPNAALERRALLVQRHVEGRPGAFE